MSRRSLTRHVVAIAATAALTASVAVARASSALDWAYPAAGSDGPPPANAAGIVSLAGSRVTYPVAAIDDGFLANDWWPATHPPLPSIVKYGRKPDVMACGDCHLPDGLGRPENASLAGLPARYIAAQVAEMKQGERASERPGWAPITYMHLTARTVRPDEVARAAAYFAGLPLRARIHVVETAEIPAVEADAFAYRRRAGAGRETLGQRIVETPDDFERFEKRDSTVAYTAYVPPGALARGRRIALSGDDERVPACVTCHAAGLRGAGDVPPLAGRSPTTLVRQLDAFRRGTRHAAADAPMRAEAARLSPSEMIDVAAYAASLAP